MSSAEQTVFALQQPGAYALLGQHTAQAKARKYQLRKRLFPCGDTAAEGCSLEHQLSNPTEAAVLGHHQEQPHILVVPALCHPFMDINIEI